MIILCSSSLLPSSRTGHDGAGDFAGGSRRRRWWCLVRVTVIGRMRAPDAAFATRPPRPEPSSRERSSPRPRPCAVASLPATSSILSAAFRVSIAGPGTSRTRSRNRSRRCCNPSHRLRTRYQRCCPRGVIPSVPDADYVIVHPHKLDQMAALALEHWHDLCLYYGILCDFRGRLWTRCTTRKMAHPKPTAHHDIESLGPRDASVTIASFPQSHCTVNILERSRVVC